MFIRYLGNHRAVDQTAIGADGVDLLANAGDDGEVLKIDAWCQCALYTVCTDMDLKTSVVDPDSLNPDMEPDRALQDNPDPDPVFGWPKIEEKNSWKKFVNFWS